VRLVTVKRAAFWSWCMLLGMIVFWSLVALFVAGCGSDEKSPEDRLVGDWILDRPPCAFVVGFSAFNEYAVISACVLTDGTTGAQVEVGNYVADDRTIHTAPYRSSCPPKATPDTASYAVSGPSLTIITAGSAVTLMRYNPVPGTGVVRHGCWDDGTFTPGDLIDL
jgi:hypothetical protein